jgi:Ca-activated chloride channel family protein
VQADYVLDYDVISMARESRLYLMARITAGPSPKASQRRPLNLGVVLDRSGSMGGDKLDYVKKAAQFLVQHLGANDHFSLVTYDDNVSVGIPPTTVVHKEQLNKTIQQITSGGSTNLSGGWLQGCQLTAQNLAEGQSNRVLLLTDGLANVGITDVNRLASMARQKRDEGVTTTTMGVGMDFNEDLLTRMASEGGGAFYFIDSPEQAPAIFTEELRDLLSVVGQNLTITITLSPRVQMVRHLNHYPSERQGSAITFRLGDVFSDEIKSLLLELSIPALQTLGKVEVARLRFDYDELADERVTHRTLEMPILINTVADEDYQEQSPNKEVVKTALLLRAAQAREEAIHEADKGNYDAAKQALADIADEIQKSKIDDQDLNTQHDMLREEAMDMDLGDVRYDSHTRKLHSTQLSQSDRYYRFAQMNADQHMRQKVGREAIERSGQTPTAMTWKQERWDLSAIPDQGKLGIGRAEDSDIVILEGDVSRQHCEIVRDDDNLYLEDLGTSNGTFANGGRITGRFRLSIGDLMTVGSRMFRFE